MHIQEWGVGALLLDSSIRTDTTDLPVSALATGDCIRLWLAGEQESHAAGVLHQIRKVIRPLTGIVEKNDIFGPIPPVKG